MSTLQALARWPVKSLGGESLTSADIDLDGLAGDRRHTVVDLHTGETLTADKHPGMLRWTASTSHVRDATGREWELCDAATSRALGGDLRRVVSIRDHTDPQQYYAGTVLITVERSRAALEAALGRRVDLRRFRSNLHLDLDTEAFAEAGWTGRRLTVGDAELDLLHPCDRCVIAARDPDTGEKWPQLLRYLRDEHELLFGIFAAPRNAARITVGDPVRLH